VTESNNDFQSVCAMSHILMHVPLNNWVARVCRSIVSATLTLRRGVSKCISADVAAQATVKSLYYVRTHLV
jgi:hypothetical protein